MMLLGLFQQSNNNNSHSMFSLYKVEYITMDE